jgi:tagaturonate reductase
LIKEEDKLMSIGEPFGLWVIQNKGDIKNILKEGKHNIDVLFAKDISYYKKRKVRVLNGSHTNLVPISLWKGKETVFDVMKDDKLLEFIKDTLKEDIIPFVGEDIEATTSFSEEVLQRFLNPYLNHQLTSIALNSISKWKARDLCSFIDYYQRHNKIATYLTIGFAYLINMYQNIEHIQDKYICHLPNRDIVMNDEEKYLNYFNKHTVKDFLSDVSIWGRDLTSFNELEETINGYLKDIKNGKDII